MLPFAVLLLQALTTCLAYDIQLEGVLNMGNDLMRVLKENQMKDLSETPVDNTNKNQRSTKHIYQRADDSLPTRTQQLHDYVYHIKKKGEKTLKFLGKYIRTDMELDRDITHLIHNAIDDFNRKLEDYLNIVYSDKPEYEIDEEFVFLDMAETANRLLYGDGRKLLNDIIEEVNDKSKTADFQLINKKLYKESVTSKKEEMVYICSNYRVCRNYPSFTDYSADFISEMIKMPNSKFDIIVEVFTNIIKSKSFFLKTIIRDEDWEVIIKDIDNFLQDSSSIREFLSVLRAVMTQRFKIVHNSNTVLRARTKAVRILLDIIDKALLSEDEDLLSIDFSNTVHAMRFWVGGQRDDIDEFLGKFIDNVIKTLNYAFTKNTKTEIKALVEVILRGKTDSKVFEYMNKIGSKFVRGEDVNISNDIEDIF